MGAGKPVTHESGVKHSGTMLVLVLVALLPLAACIAVEDYETYWAAAGLDPGLAGTGKVVAFGPADERGPCPGVGDFICFVRNGDVYEWTSYGSERLEGAPGSIGAKTLTIGPYQFIAVGAPKGFMLRYKLNGRTLEFCGTATAQWTFFTKHIQTPST
jgi:hypothetical protein